MYALSANRAHVYALRTVSDMRGDRGPMDTKRGSVSSVGDPDPPRSEHVADPRMRSLLHNGRSGHPYPPVRKCAMEFLNDFEGLGDRRKGAPEWLDTGRIASCQSALQRVSAWKGNVSVGNLTEFHVHYIRSYVCGTWLAP